MALNKSAINKPENVVGVSEAEAPPNKFKTMLQPEEAVWSAR